MKYLFILFIFLFTGCDSIVLNLDNIKSIQYNEITIIEEDYEMIKNNLLNLEFECSNKKISGKPLKIVTDNNLYELIVSNNYIQFKNNNKYCSNKNNEIYNTLIKIENKYNKDFYTINYTNEYVINSDDEVIRIDKNDNYLVINSFHELYNFTINEIKITNNDYEEINLIYSKDFINSNNIIIRKDDFTNIKISFSNKYNYIVNIIPYVENQTIKFKEEIYQQNKT